MDDTTKSSAFSRLDLSILRSNEALVLALASASAYWFAYLFQVAKFHFFRIPATFVDISVAAVLSAFGGIILFFFSKIVVLEAITQLRNRLVSWHSRVITWTLLLYLAMGIPVFVLTGWDLEIVIRLAAHFGFALLFILASPIILHPRTKGYKAKLDAQQQNLVYAKSVIMDFIDFFGWGALKILLYFIFLSWYAYVAGLYFASVRGSFYVLKSDPELALVARYDAYYIGVRFDRVRETFLGSYKLVPIDKPGADIQLQYLGDLDPFFIKH